MTMECDTLLLIYFSEEIRKPAAEAVLYFSLLIMWKYWWGFHCLVSLAWHRLLILHILLWQGSLVVWDVRTGDPVRVVKLGHSDGSVFVKQILLLRDSVACDYSNQLRIVHFPLVTDKSEWSTTWYTASQCLTHLHKHLKMTDMKPGDWLDLSLQAVYFVMEPAENRKCLCTGSPGSLLIISRADTMKN